MNAAIHTTVLLEEAVTALNPQPGKLYVDGTLGGGGHTRRLCQLLDPTSRVIGIDQDPVAVEEARRNLADCPVPYDLIQGNFGHLQRLLLERGIPRVDGGVILDLGVSAFQIATPERGFSFQYGGPLDMRMDPALETTAADLVNTLPAAELADLFFKNADEKLSRQIAGAIVKARPIENTKQLAEIAERVYHQKGVKARNIHPATRIFQALRIAVNQEIYVLQRFLEQLPQVLLPGARVAIITFHSIEDRTVKQFFRLASAQCVCPPRQPVCTCNQQPAFKVIGKVTPSSDEIERNPKARSAKLRVAERI